MSSDPEGADRRAAEGQGAGWAQEVASLRQEIVSLKANDARMSMWIAETQPAVQMLFRLAVPSAAAAHVAMQEMIAVVTATGGDASRMNFLADKLRAALQSLDELSRMGKPDEGG